MPNRRNPSLRFQEYNTDWNSYNLFEIANIFDGTHQTPSYVEEGVPFVSVESIGNIERSKKFITKEAFEKNFKTKPQKGDILMTRITAGIIGATAIVQNNDPLGYYVSLALIRRTTEIEIVFLSYRIGTSQFKHELHKRIIHVAFPKKINLGDIGDCKLSLPSLPEQQKIADFLSAVDKKIQLLTRKKELLEEYKKGVMQKIFSCEIRFKDENGNEFPEWKEKKLREIVEIIGGGTPDTSVDNYWNGDIQWFTPSEIVKKSAKQSIRTITESGFKQSSAKLLPKGTILFTSRATIGEVSIAEMECSTNQGFQSLIVNSNNSIEFLYYWVKQSKNEFLRRSQGSTFLEISKNEMGKINLYRPSLKEQSIIGNFLSSLDQKIQSIQSQISLTQQFKKGLLQQMFV